MGKWCAEPSTSDKFTSIETCGIEAAPELWGLIKICRSELFGSEDMTIAQDQVARNRLETL